MFFRLCQVLLPWSHQLLKQRPLARCTPACKRTVYTYNTITHTITHTHTRARKSCPHREESEVEEMVDQNIGMKAGHAHQYTNNRVHTSSENLMCTQQRLCRNRTKTTFMWVNGKDRRRDSSTCPTYNHGEKSAR